MNTNQPNIYDIPEIKALMDAERSATDPDTKRELHNQFVRLVKIEQMRRGQRTKITYRKD